GELDVPASFERFSDRIILRASMSYLDMLDYLAAMDINIAPLELNNPYTASKSELKIFEAALAGVPSVVSAVDSYARLIDQGNNGFLAHDRDDWKTCLTALVADADLRQRVGEASRRDFVPRFHIDNNIDAILQVYEELRREKPAEIKVDPACLDIAWVVPAPSAGAGGHRNIYRAVRNLARFGHKLTVYHFGWTGREDVKSFVQRHFFDLPGVHFAPASAAIGPHDVCFATHWSTVSPMMRYRDVIRYPFYFVQDFEPFFYCMGSDYVRAEKTYQLGLTHITSGPWPAAILRKRYGADADHFLFPVQRSVYQPGPRVKRNKNIVFFARPEMPRRCFDLGLEMLARLHQRHPDIEIILFGSARIDSGQVPFAHTNLGLLPDVEDLATLYRNADLGIVFSTTNPSLVPYEMMACGLAVCDLDLEAAATNYGGTDNVFLLDLDPETMAEQIVNILANESERRRRARNGCTFVERFPDEEGCGRRIEELIVRRIVAGKLCLDSSSLSVPRAA
ncbi:MAG: glycosyltransferase, partial [Gemmataceae bacterium]